MVSVRQAVAEDFRGVYPLLRALDNPHLAEEDWGRLFVDHGGQQGGRFGWLLQDGDAIVGFLATLYSERTVRGRKHRLCNLSSWIVRDEYRGHSLALLGKVLAQKDLTITNLSPTPQVLQMCLKLGFAPLDRSERIVLPSPLVAPRPGCRVVLERGEMERSLAGESLRILEDHQLPHHRHALIRSPEGDCHVMMNRSRKAIGAGLRVPVARVHHVSDPEVFLRHLPRLLLRVMSELGVAALVVEERAIGGRAIWHSFRRPGGPRTAAFRPNGLRPEDVDGLYSELAILNF